MSGGVVIQGSPWKHTKITTASAANRAENLFHFLSENEYFDLYVRLDCYDKPQSFTLELGQVYYFMC